MNGSGHIALTFSAFGADADALEGFFFAHTALAGSQENEDGSVTFYLPETEWTDAVQSLLEAVCGSRPEIEFLASEAVPERDWNAEWEASVLPQRVTEELVITPSWKLEEAQQLGLKYLLQIDPKMSFGTGHHETTRLCLHAMEDLDLSGKHALDLGTGTGVLAMYALLRGARRAVGIDTDSWSIQNAIENRTLNGFSESQFELRHGTLESAVAPAETFDIILANLHRNILLEHCEAIRDCSPPGAYIVLSGILIYDAHDIRATYGQRGHFEFVTELREQEWICLVFQRAK